MRRTFLLVLLPLLLLSACVLRVAPPSIGVQGVPLSADACKDGGWETLRSADGSAFENQGDCMSYVNAANGS